jgi:Uma2 family endonuclease
MSQLHHKTMTPVEFLTWEAKQELKWEFDGFQPVAMTGGTDAHSAIQVNLLAALKNGLRGQRCYPRGSDMKIEIGPKYRYPDAFVSCTPVARDSTIAVDPVMIFEVLSESTAGTDRTTKLTEYCSLSSVQRYVMLEQDQAAATVVTRTGSHWRLEVLDAHGTLVMPEIGVEVAMSELYDGLELTPLDL